MKLTQQLQDLLKQVEELTNENDTLMQRNEKLQVEYEELSHEVVFIQRKQAQNNQIKAEFKNRVEIAKNKIMNYSKPKSLYYDQLYQVNWQEQYESVLLEKQINEEYYLNEVSKLESQLNNYKIKYPSFQPKTIKKKSKKKLSNSNIDNNEKQLQSDISQKDLTESGINVKIIEMKTPQKQSHLLKKQSLQIQQFNWSDKQESTNPNQISYRTPQKPSQQIQVQSPQQIQINSKNKSLKLSQQQ